MRRALAVLVLLAACGREAPTPVSSFREAGTPIGSTTRGGPADLVGEWVVSAAYPGGAFPGEPVAGSALSVRADAGGTYYWTVTPADGTGRVVASLRPVGPGRFAIAGSDAPELWVIWTDDDFRTAAIGTPDGRFGWIMDRPGQASPDRLVAAREMLDFNGYDLAGLDP